MSKYFKIPAIRSQLGIWIYYVSSLSFDEVTDYVNILEDELYANTLLRKKKQDNIIENYKPIVDYLETQKERFFNALILAVQGGNPIWNEIRLEDYDGSDNYNMGIVTFNGKEKIFIIDGHKRALGIKEAVKNNIILRKERVPVIFVGCGNDKIGGEQVRRMHNILNRV